MHLVSSIKVLLTVPPRSFLEYNEEAFTPAQLGDDSTDKVLITQHNRQPDGRYVDPRTKQVFSFDHLRKVVSDIEVCHAILHLTCTLPLLQPNQCSVLISHLVFKAGSEADNEELRAKLDKAAAEYGSDHYATGTVSVRALIPSDALLKHGKL